MEMEFFVPPADGPSGSSTGAKSGFDWYVDLGIPADMLRLRDA